MAQRKNPEQSSTLMAKRKYKWCCYLDGKRLFEVLFSGGRAVEGELETGVPVGTEHLENGIKSSKSIYLDRGD